MNETEQLLNPQESGQSTETKLTIPDLGDVTPEQIKEWKNGYMRQDDYTRKTQALAEEKKKMFTSEPTPTQPIQQSNPTPNQTNPVQANTNSDLERQVQKLVIENELGRLKNNYQDFNENAVLDKAIEMINKGVPSNAIDFEMLYKATREVDEASIRERLVREMQSGVDTSSLIGGNDMPPSSTPKLSADEDKIRIKMGVTLEEWLKYK